MDESLFFFGLLALLLCLLIWLSRRLNRVFYKFLKLCTGSDEIAVIGLYVLFLPGLILHELTHWFAAYLLRMRPTSLTLWPVKRGSRIEMGSVSMSRASIWRETLVGMAPLFTGTGLIALIVGQVLRMEDLILEIRDLRLLAAWELLQNSMNTADSAIWLYLVFAVANGMLPSASDRQSLALVLYYLAIGGLMYVAAERLGAGVSYEWLPLFATRLTVPLQTLCSLLFLAAIMNSVLLGVTGFYVYLLEARRPKRN